MPGRANIRAVMRRPFRIHAAIALTVLLILTGQGLAMARGSTGPVGQVVLCAGSGPVVVFLDEDGNPTGPPHFCPDFTLHLIGDATLPEEAALPRRAAAVAHPPAAGQSVPGRAVHGFHARGPPRPDDLS